MPTRLLAFKVEIVMRDRHTCPTSHVVPLRSCFLVAELQCDIRVTLNFWGRGLFHMRGGKVQPSSPSRNVAEESVYTGLCHTQLYAKTAACSNLRARTLTVSTENTGPIVLAVQIASSWHLGCCLLFFLSHFFFFEPEALTSLVTILNG